jgi:hypothetical protein
VKAAVKALSDLADTLSDAEAASSAPFVRFRDSVECIGCI